MIEGLVDAPLMLFWRNSGTLLIEADNEPMTNVSAGIMRESVVLGCASSCQSQRVPIGKLLNLQPILSGAAGS